MASLSLSLSRSYIFPLLSLQAFNALQLPGRPGEDLEAFDFEAAKEDLVEKVGAHFYFSGQ